MTATHMEHVLQHGFVLSELNKLIRSRPTLNDAKLWRIEFIQERGTGRRFARVYLSPISPTEPKLVFEILERDRLESLALWESGTRARLLEAWQKLDHPLPAPPPPAPHPYSASTVAELRAALAPAGVRDVHEPVPSPATESAAGMAPAEPAKRLGPSHKKKSGGKTPA